MNKITILKRQDVPMLEEYPIRVAVSSEHGYMSGFIVWNRRDMARTALTSVTLTAQVIVRTPSDGTLAFILAWVTGQFGGSWNVRRS